MKRITSLLLVVMILLSIPVFSTTNDPIKVIINNDVMVFDVNPTIIEGRTVLPVGAIFKALGLEVGWDGATRTVTGSNSDVIIKLQIDQVLATINEKEVTLDVPATIINGRTMVPARFIAEATGAIVDWDATKRTISIDKPVIDTGTNNGMITISENELIFGEVSIAQIGGSLDYTFSTEELKKFIDTINNFNISEADSKKPSGIHTASESPLTVVLHYNNSKTMVFIAFEDGETYVTDDNGNGYALLNKNLSEYLLELRKFLFAQP